MHLYKAVAYRTTDCLSCGSKWAPEQKFAGFFPDELLRWAYEGAFKDKEENTDLEDVQNSNETPLLVYVSNTSTVVLNREGVLLRKQHQVEQPTYEGGVSWDALSGDAAAQKTQLLFPTQTHVGESVQDVTASGQEKDGVNTLQQHSDAGRQLPLANSDNKLAER